MVGGKSAQRFTLRLIWGDFLEKIHLSGCTSSDGDHYEPTWFWAIIQGSKRRQQVVLSEGGIEEKSVNGISGRYSRGDQEGMGGALW